MFTGFLQKTKNFSKKYFPKKYFFKKYFLKNYFLKKINRENGYKD